MSCTVEFILYDELIITVVKAFRDVDNEENLYWTETYILTVD